MPEAQPPGNMTSAEMEELISKMKAHKLQKSVNQSISEMDSALLGKPPQSVSGQVKKAYWAGVKFAEDSLSENSSEDNPAIEKDKNPEEEIIDMIRRGWPDPQAVAKANHPDASDKREAKDDDIAESEVSTKDRLQMNKFSPKVTV